MMLLLISSATPVSKCFLGSTLPTFSTSTSSAVLPSSALIRSPYACGQLEHLIDDLLVLLRVILELVDGKARSPVALVQVHQHLLLELVLAVVDDDGVVVPVETVN